MPHPRALNEPPTLDRLPRHTRGSATDAVLAMRFTGKNENLGGEVSKPEGLTSVGEGTDRPRIGCNTVGGFELPPAIEHAQQIQHLSEIGS